MKKRLSEIPEEIRQPYIREEAVQRIYNKLSNKFKMVMEGKKYAN